MISFADNELRVLLRTILAGKFSSDLRDPEIVTSPVVAAFVTRIADLVDEMDALDCPGDAQLLLRQWRNIDPRRDEWVVAVRFAKLYLLPKWFQWEETRRRWVLENLFAPFHISEDNINLFVKTMCDGVN